MVDVASLHESFGRIVQAVCLCALPVALLACGASWLHGHGIFVLRRIRGMFKGLHGVLAAIAIAALVAWAGTKPSLIAPVSTGLDSVPQQLRRPNDASATAVSVADDDGALETNGTTAVVGEFVVASATTNAVHDFSMCPALW